MHLILLASGTVVAGGTGYAVGDLLTVVGDPGVTFTIATQIRIIMATTTRFSVAKTQKGLMALLSEVPSVKSETQDLRDCYHYGTSVGGDVSNGPAPNYGKLT